MRVHFFPSLHRLVWFGEHDRPITSLFSVSYEPFPLQPTNNVSGLLFPSADMKMLYYNYSFIILCTIPPLFALLPVRPGGFNHLDRKIQRSDDVSMSSPQTLLLQQASVVVEALQTRLTVAESRLTSLEGSFRQQAGEMCTLKSRLASVSQQGESASVWHCPC